MKIDVYPEIIFSTARSGGKGGQNVNKVETMVEGRWKIEDSNLVSTTQKQTILTRLSNKITAEGYLLVKSQADRTQLWNKQKVIDKMNAIINQSLEKKKARIATKIPRIVHEKRIQGKKMKSEIKANRQKPKPGGW